MPGRTTNIKGQPFALEGPELHPGDSAPDFHLQARTEQGLKEITPADFAGKTLLLSVAPSLDTPVCALQTRRFNEQAARLPDSVSILTVTADLPFAQARF
ncbi:MAG TPA: redoxin family protein, partial [Chthonomonadales bacterium]|nr:redoxin family protein [Chthonomonadales bacterium]